MKPIEWDIRREGRLWSHEEFDERIYNGPRRSNTWMGSSPATGSGSSSWGCCWRTSASTERFDSVGEKTERRQSPIGKRSKAARGSSDRMIRFCLSSRDDERELVSLVVTVLLFILLVSPSVLINLS